VRDSSVTVLAPPSRSVSRSAFEKDNDEGDEEEEEEEMEFRVWPIVVGPEEDAKYEGLDDGAKLEKKAEGFARSLRKKGRYSFDTRYSTGLNVEMKWPGEDPFHFPAQYQSPSLTASRSFSGYGQERGKVELLIRNSEASRERVVTYYEVLPWFIKPFLHTLSVQAEAEDFDEEMDNLVRFQDEMTAPLVLSLNYSPPTQRQRPTHLEIKLRVPPQSTLRLSLDFDKSFLRYAEHPPDAHRGFDVAPAMIILENGDKVYTNPALIEVAVPDFSMPYNVM
jgi:hypothetical protein